MSKEKAASLVAQKKPQGTEDGNANQNPEPMSILTKLPSDVKVLRDFIKRRHIPMMDLLEVVQTIYPRCDKSLLSKCAHGEETGAMLRGDALRALMIHFREDGQAAPVKRGRTKEHRIQCRVGDAVYEALQRRLKQTRMNTQDYLEALIRADLKGDIHEQTS